MTEPCISVGILTDGNPTVTQTGDYTQVEGVVIGKQFHWEQRLSLKYAGKIEQTDHGLINRLPIEDYIKSVVSSEMNPKAPVEFIRAHAIISRSWAMRKLYIKESPSDGIRHSDSEIITWQESDTHIGFDVCSDDHCQRYQGITNINSRVEKAVESTRGILLTDTDSGTIADARFSKCCGGETELFSTCWADKDMPYLTHIHDPYCNPDRLSQEQRITILSDILKDYDVSTDYYRWEESVTPQQIRVNLQNRFDIDKGRVISLKPIEYGKSGRIKLLKVICENGEIIIGKELAIRRLLSPTHLFSSAFEIKSQTDRFLLHGRGWGHGVGLCQIGAAVMASEEKSAEEILSFYFPNTSLVKFY